MYYRIRGMRTLNLSRTGVTILLSLTVFMNMVSEIMPRTSDAVPLIGITYWPAQPSLANVYFPQPSLDPLSALHKLPPLCMKQAPNRR